MPPERTIGEQPGDQPESDDQKLVRLIRNGDEVAFQKLWAACEAPLLRFCEIKGATGMAEDLVQEIGISVWRGLQTCIPDDFKAWLWRLCFNKCAKSIKHKTIRRKIWGLETDLRPDESESTHHQWIPSKIAHPFEAYNSEELWAAVYSWLNTLSDRDRQIFQLRVFEGCTLGVVGVVVGISKGNVSRNYQRLLDSLRNYLAEREFDSS